MKRMWDPGEFRSCTNRMLVKDVGYVSCGKCENCHKERKLMWIGRNLAEIETGEYGVFASLTYSRTDRLYDEYEPVGAFVFVKKHVADYLSRLRKHIWTDWKQAGRNVSGRKQYCVAHDLNEFPEKPRLRTFVVGERCELGRCHWHLLLYFTGCKGPAGLPLDRYCFHGQYPEEVTDGLNLHVIEVDVARRNFRPGSGIDWHQSDRTFWPHGMVKYLAVVPQHPYYVCNYIVEDQTGASEVARPSQSRRPILGAGYLEQLAQQHVDQLLSPQDRTFTLPRNEGYGGDRRLPNGMKVKSPLTTYWLGRSAARVFALTFVRLWDEAHCADPQRYTDTYPSSEFIDNIVECEEERLVKKQYKGKRKVEDKLREEFSDAIRREAYSLRHSQPLDLSTFRLKGEMMETAAAFAEKLSPVALQRLAEASWSESRRLKRTVIKRHAKLMASAERRRSRT